MSATTIVFRTLLFISVVRVLQSQFSNVGSFLGFGNIPEEATLDVPEIIVRHGYVVEKHTVQTEDGYLLKVHRIPYGRKRKSKKLTKRPPILLMHGLCSSSSDWILTGPKKALGYMLADEGFDVWLGNARGNYYSKNHTTLDPQFAPFWNFTFHEIGYYDVPALIDYILKETGHKKLHYIGHSQGCTVFFVMTSLKESYNDKVASMNAFAPAMYNATTLGSLTDIFNSIGYISNTAKDYAPREVYPRGGLPNNLGTYFCTGSIFYNICKNLVFSIVGQSNQFNESLFPLFFSHAPAGASSLQFTHYCQFYLTDEFKQFDYGERGNIIKYGRPVPPMYDLKKVKTPVMIHYGETDSNINHQFSELDKLGNELGNSVGTYKVEATIFNHIDFIWGMNAKKLLYEPVIQMIKGFEKNNNELK